MPIPNRFDRHFVLIKSNDNTTIIGLGYKQFQCEMMSNSAQIPISAHSVRMGDIDVIGAMGDSLTVSVNNIIIDIIDKAGVRSLPNSTNGDYRGLSFSIGGDMSLDEHITIPSTVELNIA
jgi:hypothetical protein